MLFIVGRTTLFTPVDINLEQVIDFLNFYACRLSTAGHVGNKLSVILDVIGHQKALMGSDGSL
jgi:hypothetical protein